MSTVPPVVVRQGVLRHSRWDALLLALAAGHGALLLWAPVAPVIAIGLWWNCNTIAHNFIHRPFFRSRLLNRAFALYLSVLLGIPQSLWRDRHQAHHAGVRWRPRLSGPLLAEAFLVLSLWAVLIVRVPLFFLTAYLPGYVAGLALCWLHGYYEHAHGTVSHHGPLYNLLFFNDGYHVEHHARPGQHWTRLPELARPDTPASRWPAVLRWLELLSLDGLETAVLPSPLLQRFVLRRHEAAFRRLLPSLPEAPRIAVIGGGLFPRTLLVLRRLLPGGRFVVIDRSSANIATAQSFLPDGAATPGDTSPKRQRGDDFSPALALRACEVSAVEFVNQCYEPGLVSEFDLVVFPLAFDGDREAVYRQPPARRVLVHDWLWRRRGRGTVVSLLLLKRLNLVTR